MAAPIANKIILPSDTGNTGKNIRTQTRVVGADTVHEHIYVKTRQAAVLGIYRIALPQQTILATAQNGTTTGFLWGHVPNAVTGKKARLRTVRCESQHSTLLATPTAPRIVVSRMTFTGTASGAAQAGVKVDTGYPSPILDLRTAVAGLTVSLVGLLGAMGICGALTAVGAYAPASIRFGDNDEEDEWPTFAPGEGFVLWQDTAGTASDTRKANLTLVWDEIDVS